MKRTAGALVLLTILGGCQATSTAPRGAPEMVQGAPTAPPVAAAGIPEARLPDGHRPREIILLPESAPLGTGIPAELLQAAKAGVPAGPAPVVQAGYTASAVPPQMSGPLLIAPTPVPATPAPLATNPPPLRPVATMAEVPCRGCTVLVPASAQPPGQAAGSCASCQPAGGSQEATPTRPASLGSPPAGATFPAFVRTGPAFTVPAQAASSPPPGPADRTGLDYPAAVGSPGPREDGLAAVPAVKTASLPPGPPEPAVSAPPGARVRQCKSKRLVLSYDIKGAGSDAVAAVDLWFTRDGQKWHKIDLTNQSRSHCVVEVNKEGLYGFTVQARGTKEPAQPPPQPGERPQFWAEVDLTPPVVQLTKVEIGPAAPQPTLSVFWWAGDKNLAPRPISLSYAERPNGPWLPIASQLENTGRYVWKAPSALPPQLYVRVEASDLAGNVGEDQTANSLVSNGGQPAAVITGVEPEEAKVPVVKGAQTPPRGVQAKPGTVPGRSGVSTFGSVPAPAGWRPVGN
jgi:hypothetical protein